MRIILTSATRPETEAMNDFTLPCANSTIGVPAVNNVNADDPNIALDEGARTITFLCHHCHETHAYSVEFIADQVSTDFIQRMVRASIIEAHRELDAAIMENA